MEGRRLGMMLEQLGNGYSHHQPEFQEVAAEAVGGQRVTRYWRQIHSTLKYGGRCSAPEIDAL